ncbi:LytR/AlgR family response regulator transcription factor [Streptococcus thoraltensis]|uniref:LytR/AlgR family response regulator transcription factor n=1 Tax=Streptococcus thoraltensis TaxID=55085 RepID=UPI001F57C0A3|nr:LytTR family DNA-binding domain-containing protein [Streptococcus thoraltensis]
MNIYILEDNLFQKSYLEFLIEDILRENQFKSSAIFSFDNPDKLIQAIAGKGQKQIFLLDIEIHQVEQAGLQLAQRIREQDPLATIVFITTHTEMMPLVFQLQIGVMDYLDKDLSKEALKQRLTSLLDKINESSELVDLEDYFIYETEYTEVQLPFAKINYIETSPRPHKLILHTNTDRIEFTGKLQEILQKEKRFIKCHRSYVVNPKNISKINTKERAAYFSDGSSCIISRTMVKELKRIVKEGREV